MKKFKVTMVATAIKEIFVSAKDKSSAIDKVEKCYLDDEKLDFTEDDIKQLRMTCKEIISRRRELFESKGYDMPVDSSDIFIKEVIDVFDRANKTVCAEYYEKRNRMKKIIAVLLTVVMAFCLTACGKETGVDVTGKYTCIGEHYGDTGYQTPMQNVIIELKKGGKGTYSGGFDYEMTWKLDGEKFSGKVTFLGLENAMEGTLKDGVLEVVYGDAHMLFL